MTDASEPEKACPLGVWVLPFSRLSGFTEALMAHYPVMGPRPRPDQPGFHHFDWLEFPDDLDLHYTATTLPPKKAFFPPKETLFYFTSGPPPAFETGREDAPFVLTGVHPCDLAGLAALDTAYLHPPADRLWMDSRKRAIIIGVDCLPDAYCFCTSLGTWDARHPADLFLTEIGAGYLVETFTPAGSRLLKGQALRTASDRDLEQAAAHRQAKKNAVTARINAGVDALAGILDRGGLAHIWKETAERCYGCGSCNTTCPTCFCFDMHDAFDFSLENGIRYRTWDSCQLPDFALIAGGENMRPHRWQRVRHRWHRKFLYLYRAFGRPYCTGCGRCSRACTADINMVDVTNALITAGRKEAAHARRTDPH